MIPGRFVDYFEVNLLFFFLLLLLLLLYLLGSWKVGRGGRGEEGLMERRGKEMDRVMSTNLFLPIYLLQILSHHNVRRVPRMVYPHMMDVCP